MGIEFQSDKETLYLSSKDFSILYPVFCILNTETGVNVDEYSDSILSPDHVKTLLSLISNIINQDLLSDNILQLLKLFEKAVRTKTWTKIIGD